MSSPEREAASRIKNRWAGVFAGFGSRGDEELVQIGSGGRRGSWFRLAVAPVGGMLWA